MKHRLLSLLLPLLLAPVLAHAAGTPPVAGMHVGFSTDPSQVVLGGHLQMADIAPQVDFVPSVDLGFGDNVTVFSFNGDFHYRIHVAGATWQPYAGAGVSLHVFSRDTGVLGNRNSDTVGDGSLIFGADVPTKTGNRFFAEGKLSLGDGPTFKALAGWSFNVR